MLAMKSVPIPVKKDQEGWVVCLVSGERVFVKADDYYQDETSLIFHNGHDRARNGAGQDNYQLVMQIEKIHMSWFMPNNEELEVLIAAPPEEEEEDESED